MCTDKAFKKKIKFQRHHITQPESKNNLSTYEIIKDQTSKGMHLRPGVK